MVSGDKITFVIAWYTFIVSVIYQSGHCQDIVKCMKCHRVTSIEFCEEMEICDARNQVCFVEQNIEIGGTIVITAGCRDKQVCDALGCYGETYDGHVAPNSTYFGAPFQCHHCCAGDFCNIHGCPELHDISQHTWTRCVKCDHVVKPEECEKLTTCGPHETCVQETLSHGSEVRYSLRCMEKAKCDLLDTIHNMGKRNYVPTWAECCRNHLCNGYKPMMQADPVINLPTYTCPPGPKVTTGPPTAKTTSTTTLKPTTTSTPQPTTTSTPQPTTTSTPQPTTTSTPQPTTTSTQQPTSTSQPTTTSTPQPTTTPRPTAETTLLSTTTTPLQTTTTLSQSTSSSIFTSTLVVTTTSTVNSLSTQPVGGSTSSGTTTHVTTLHSQSTLQNISITSTVSQTASSSSPSPITTAQSGCVDQHSDCNSFDKDVLCTDPSFVDFAKENCALYCGLCVQGGTTEQPLHTAVIVVTQASSPPSGCQDKDADCISYDKDMLCSDPSFQEFAKDNCAMYCGFCGQGTTGQQTATTSTTQPTTSTTTQPVCKDMSTDCSSYDKDMLCSDPAFKEFAKDNCAMYCGFCGQGTTGQQTATTYTTQTTTSTTTQPVCKDMSTDCSSYDKDMLCSDPAFKEFAKDNCAMYCGFCGQGTTGQQTATTSTTQPTTSTTTQPVCKDMSTDCSSYDKDMLCSDPAFKEFAKDNCAMYCGFCGQGTTGQQNTTALTTQSSTTSTKTQPVCKDMSTDCSSYDKDMLCSDPSFQEFAKDNCAIYCGYCGQGTTVQQPAASTSIIQLTTMITQPPVTSTTTQPVCKDMSTDCSNYDKDMLCSDPSFQEFAKNNCAMYCGFCGQGTTSQQTATTSTTQPSTPPTTQPVCKDMTTDCSSYDKDMLCSDPSFQEFAKDNCAMYCGFCGQGTTDQQPQTAVVVVTRPVSTASAVATTTLTQTSTQSVCKDMTTDCSSYDKNALCFDPAFQEYAKDNCALYCGFCGQGTTDQQPQTAVVVVTRPVSTASAVATTTLTQTSTQSVCKDMTTDCSSYDKNALCFDPAFQEYAKDNCALYCGFCGQGTTDQQPQTAVVVVTRPVSTASAVATTTLTQTSTQSVCKDMTTDCSSYDKNALCFDPAFQEYAKDNCALYCGFCGQESSSPVTTTDPPTTSTVKSTSSIVSTAQATIHANANTTLDVSATTTHQTLTMVNSTTPSTNLTTTVSNTTPVVETSSPTIAATTSQSVLSSITSLPISTTLSLLTTNQQSCVDIDPGCTSYGYAYICQQEAYKQWAMENCRNFCGFCNVPTTPPPCIDENPNCDQYGGKDYICADGYRDWALANCKKFCGLCPNSTGNKRYVKDMTDMVEVAVPVKQPEKSLQTNKSANEA